MATMATTLASPLSKTPFLETQSSLFHGIQIPSSRILQPIRSTSQNNSRTSSSIYYCLDVLWDFLQLQKESIVSCEMIRRYMTDMITYADTDVVLMTPNYPNVNVAIIEQSVSPGGGAWLGGHLFSAMVVRKPAYKFLDELEIEYDEQDTYVIIKYAALFTSTIMSKLLARPNAKLFNAVAAEDLIVKNDKVGGVVTNWALVSMNHDTQSCMDPNVISEIKGKPNVVSFKFQSSFLSIIHIQMLLFMRLIHLCVMF
ncbi:hypothetical protein MKX01_025919 [Papaver californicum]|nr:hypothetical protein MKX01_025919 [Papaver californicum]